MHAEWRRSTSMVDFSSDLYSVALVGPLDGWAVGSRDTILRTSDAGASWQAAASGLSEQIRARVSWHAISFHSSTCGWIVGSFSKVLHTSDGMTWEEQVCITCLEPSFDVGARRLPSQRHTERPVCFVCCFCFGVVSHATLIDKVLSQSGVHGPDSKCRGTCMMRCNMGCRLLCVQCIDARDQLLRSS